MSPTAPIRLVVPEAHAGERLDRVLAALLPDRSRALIQKHLEAGAVLVDGAPPERGRKTIVSAGSSLEYTPPPIEPSTLEAEDIPLSILFEDEQLLVVDKPAGLVVHPALGHGRGTLVNAILHHVKELAREEGDQRPGVVHRLDKDTTGALVVAKTPRAHELLSALFAERKVEKVYWAVVKGTPKLAAGSFDTLYGRDPRNRKKFSSKVQSGKRAVTHYKILERYKDCSLLEVRLETGRTHQIRAHFADAGHPLLGDAAYGRTRPNDPIARPALHAKLLAFEHPFTHQALRVEAPLPTDFVALLAALRAK